MSKLMEKTKDALIALAKKAGVSSRGTKEDIVERLAKKKAQSKGGFKSSGIWVNPDAAAENIKKGQAAVEKRKKLSLKQRRALEKRRKKAGSAVGEAQ